MKFIHKSSKVATAVAVSAVALLPGMAQADAVAQSILNITGFSATLSDPLALQSVTVRQNGNVSADFNGAPVAFNQPNTALDFSKVVSVGPNLGNYAPNVAFPGSTISVGSVNGNFAGSAMSVTGSVLAPGGAVAKLDSTVSITPTGNGSGDSNVNLNSGFVFRTDRASTVTFDFTAEAFLRAYLNAFPGTMDPLSAANASFEWSMKITQGNTTVFSWSPDGSVGAGPGIFGGTETQDAFALSDSVTAVFDQDDIFEGPLTGRFTATTVSLPAGQYTLGIVHKSVADADIQVVPEPSMLALTGIALLGAGFASRRRLTK